MKRSSKRKISTVEATEPKTDDQWAESLLSEDPIEEATQEASAELTDPDEPDPLETEGPDDYTEDKGEAETAGHEEPERFVVKVNGEEVEVTLEDLKRDFSGQSYIQRGMREAAEAKKAIEAERQSLQAEQRRILEFAQAIQTQGLQPMPKAPDPVLANTDPVGYIRKKAQYDAQIAAYQDQQNQIRSLQHQQSEAAKHQHAALLMEQSAMLAERVPEFSNPETAEKVKARLLKVGSETYGYSEAELAGITDARAVQVLHDAAKWRELQASTAAAKKTPDAPRTMKPAARRPEPAQLARARLTQKAKQSQSTEDWAATLLE
jgi:hypothetical protein